MSSAKTNKGLTRAQREIVEVLHTKGAMTVWELVFEITARNKALPISDADFSNGFEKLINRKITGLVIPPNEIGVALNADWKVYLTVKSTLIKSRKSS